MLSRLGMTEGSGDNAQNWIINCQEIWQEVDHFVQHVGNVLIIIMKDEAHGKISVTHHHHGDDHII